MAYKSQILEVAAGGTGRATLTNHGILVGATTTAITQLSVGTNGQVLIGATGADPAFATLSSSDSSITFTPGANTLSLQVAGGTSVGKTITGDSGGALSPTGGNWNILGSGSTTTSGAASTLTVALTGLTNHAVLVGAGTSTITKVGPSSTAGQVLQSGGSLADPAYSTPTYPSASGSAGTILRSDGTNNVYTTSTYPNTNAINTLLYASSANVMSALATANDGLLVTSNTGVPSILAGPGTTGNILQSNAASAPSFSTATYPSTATGTGTILRADGTNWVATTATYPATTTINQILYSSANNVIGEITAANDGVLISSHTGVPSWLSNSGTPGWVLTANTNLPPSWQAISTGITTTQYDVLVGGATNTIVSVGPGSAGQVLQSGGNAANPAYSTATYPSTATGTGTILRANGTNWVATTSTYPNTNAINTLLYASSANVMAALPTANNSVVLTDGSGVPSLGTSLSNDFTFTKSTGGATTTLTVSETSNTANASAVIVANVAGGTAADAVHQATITAGQAWSWGLDNSDSDAFVIASSASLGTTNVMRVATTGEINYPLQSAFFANNSVADTNATGDGTFYTIIFDNEIFDQNSDYNNATGVFTAPFTGRYHMSASVIGSNIAAAHNNGACILVTSNRNIDNNWINIGAVKNASNVWGTVVTNCVDMDAADTSSIQFYAAGSTKTVTVSGGSSSTFFSGYLEC